MANIENQDNNESCDIALIEKLGEKGQKVLLVMIKANKPQNMSTIRKAADIGSDTIYSAMMSLLKYNLIIELDDVEGNQRVFKLTEKGSRVAVLLKQADDELTKSA